MLIRSSPNPTFKKKFILLDEISIFERRSLANDMALKIILNLIYQISFIFSPPVHCFSQKLSEFLGYLLIQYCKKTNIGSNSKAVLGQSFSLKSQLLWKLQFNE